MTVVCAGVLLAASLLVAAGAGGASVSFETVARGVHSRLSEPLQAVIRTPEEWAALWTRHAGVEPPPFVDFTRDMVVAIFAGARPTSGYQVEIAGVRVVDQNIEVTYRERTPPAGAPRRPVVTAPFDVIRLPRSEMPVRIRLDPA